MQFANYRMAVIISRVSEFSKKFFLKLDKLSELLFETRACNEPVIAAKLIQHMSKTVYRA